VSEAAGHPAAAAPAAAIGRLETAIAGLAIPGGRRPDRTVAATATSLGSLRAGG
jgi:hypothetical protein